MHSVTSNAVAEFIDWVQRDNTYVKKAGFFIEQMSAGVYSIRWYWTDNDYYYLRMNCTTRQIQFGFVQNGTDYVYRTI